MSISSSYPYQSVETYYFFKQYSPTHAPDCHSEKATQQGLKWIQISDGKILNPFLYCPQEDGQV